MPALVDARPAGIDLLFRPGTTLTLTLTWPSGLLVGRTFSATLDAVPLAVDVVGDTMTVEVTDTQTAAVTEAAEWLLTEDVGGTPEPIMVGTWAPSDAAAARSQQSVTVTQGAVQVDVAALVSVGLTSHVNAPSTEAHGVVVHSWRKDGWTPFDQFTISVDRSTTNTVSVNEDRGRITSAGTDGSFREIRAHEDTNWEDSEIVSLWWSPSVMDTGTATPQMGHVHRFKEISPGVWSGYVVTNNITFSAYSTWNQNIWQTNLTTLTLGSNGGNKVFTDALNRQLGVQAVSRFTGFGLWFNDYRVVPNHLWGLAAGDVVSADVGDATFDETNLAVNAVNTIVGNVQLNENTVAQQVAVAQKFETGTITPQSHRRWFPSWVKTQLRGTVLRVKVWRYMEPEPDWGQASNVVTFDTAGAGNPAPNATAPTGSGLCGVVGAHLRNSAYMEYGDMTFRKL
jgi:hypothetical protein